MAARCGVHPTTLLLLHHPWIYAAESAVPTYTASAVHSNFLCLKTLCILKLIFRLQLINPPSIHSFHPALHALCPLFVTPLASIQAILDARGVPLLLLNNAVFNKIERARTLSADLLFTLAESNPATQQLLANMLPLVGEVRGGGGQDGEEEDRGGGGPLRSS